MFVAPQPEKESNMLRELYSELIHEKKVDIAVITTDQNSTYIYFLERSKN